MKSYDSLHNWIKLPLLLLFISSDDDSTEPCKFLSDEFLLRNGKSAKQRREIPVKAWFTSMWVICRNQADACVECHIQVFDFVLVLLVQVARMLQSCCTKARSTLEALRKETATVSQLLQWKTSEQSLTSDLCSFPLTLCWFIKNSKLDAKFLVELICFAAHKRIFSTCWWIAKRSENRMKNKI